MHYENIWPKLIRHLSTQGFSQHELAKRAGVDQSTISRLALGKAEPRFSVGRSLIELAGGQEAVDQLAKSSPEVTDDTQREAA